MIYLKGLLDKLEPYFLEHNDREFLYIKKRTALKITVSSIGMLNLLNNFTSVDTDIINSKRACGILGISNDFLHRVCVDKWLVIQPSNTKTHLRDGRLFYFQDIVECTIFLAHYALFRLVNDQVSQAAFPKKSHKSFKKFYDEFIFGKDIYSDRIKNFCKNVLEGKYEKGSK